MTISLNQRQQFAFFMITDFQLLTVDFWFFRTCYVKLLVKHQNSVEKYRSKTQTLAQWLKCY
jgi:hypothetical protein